ncbi:MAG TPA: hypothetical protein VF646_17930, partial [Cytophagales bacterium]
ELLDQGMTAVLVMVDPSTWVAYVDGLPEVSVSGGSAYQAFRMLIEVLQAPGRTATPAATSPINRVKLIRLSPAG